MADKSHFSEKPDPRPATARKQVMGHTQIITLKVHPDLDAHVKKRAVEEYCTYQEYVRRLIIADMRGAGASR